MSFERKDLIPTALVLVGLAIQTGGWVNQTVAVAILIASALMLVMFFVLREPATTSLEVPGPTTEEQERNRKGRVLSELRKKHAEAHDLYEAFVTASTDDEIAAAQARFVAWGESAAEAVATGFSRGKAEAFAQMGPLPFMYIVGVKHPNKSDYKWREKEVQMLRVTEYQDRLAKLMEGL
jgi:hypothetical protein